MNKSIISIIIPAYNEEKVIRDTLSPLLGGIERGIIEVIVVCNGCKDRTASVVKSLSADIICIETDIASKTNALNLGDEQATGFPRIYQDADVVLSLDSIEMIARELRLGKYQAASPEMKMSYNNSSWAVRSYYEIWQMLPYVEEGMIGTGVFALSEEGRNRFEKFPNVIADDGFVRALFKTSERVSVKGASSTVRAPVDLKGLLKIKTRSRLGRYELALKFPELKGNEEKKYRNAFIVLLPKVHYWSKIFIYLYVNLASRWLAKKWIEKKGFTGWQRDESSRNQSLF